MALVGPEGSGLRWSVTLWLGEQVRELVGWNGGIGVGFDCRPGAMLVGFDWSFWSNSCRF